MSAEAEAPAEQRKKRPAAKQTGTALKSTSFSALKEVFGAYSVTLTARFGIEWPQFINEITVPEKGTTQINYYLADLSQFETKPADYFLGFIPTAVKFSYDFYKNLLDDNLCT